MNKKFSMSILSIMLIMQAIPTTSPVEAKNFMGTILLQVEEKGEAWYVNPADGKRYSLGKPAAAYEVIKKLSTGITTSNINQILLGDMVYGGKDRDADGLPDVLELAVGTNASDSDSDSDGFGDKDELVRGFNPLGRGRVTTNSKLLSRVVGKFMLQADSRGEAWYINPSDSRKYYLGDPVNAFNAMKKLGLGVTNKTLLAIPVGDVSGAVSVIPSRNLIIEKAIQEMVNDERQKNGLTRLKWNDQLADVARRHSVDQAEENKGLINKSKLCSYPFIHHEGIVFGLYHSDRLSNAKLYFMSASAENIALIPKSKESEYVATGITPRDCQLEVNVLNKTYEEEVKELSSSDEKIARVKQEIASRANLTSKSPNIKIISNKESTELQVESETVTGWMNSPGHRKNILNGEYDEAGMGMAEINGYYIFTQVFMKRAQCGYKGGSCCEKEGYYPTCYIPWTCNAKSLCE